MKFEVEIVDGDIYLSMDDKEVMISSYMSRVCDVMEDIYKNNGKATLIPWPPEEKSD